MINLITVTDHAAAHIKKIMARSEGAIAFHLSVKQTGCSGYMYVPTVMTVAKNDDIKAYDADGLLIYIAADALAVIQGTTIDFVSKAFGMEQLVYDNPNADSLCGCGESFNLKDKR